MCIRDRFEGYLNQNIIKAGKKETLKYENDYEYYSEEEIERIMNG